MAEKRHFSNVDHTMHNKLSRLDLTPQRSASCFGIATPQDVQACQNFMSYPVPDSEGHGSSSPWSSSAAYLQYASSALNEHLQTREASLNYQRPQADRQHNRLQLPDNPNNQVSVHQSAPVHSYHMAYPRACPPIAMPRPVYRSASNIMDAAYGSRGFQSLGVCVASQSLCPSAVEWSSSARFAHSSSPLYASGTKKHLSTPSTYPEAAGSQSSRSQALQEQTPIYRHRADMSLAVGVSSTSPQKDLFTDACHSVAQQNVQLLYAEGNVPFGRQRTSAFTTPSPQHNNKPSNYQGSLDRRMGHLYSKNHYSNATNSVHQGSSPFSSNSMDFTGSPQNVRASSVYPNQSQHIHSGYVNAELRVQMSHLDGPVQASEGPFQVNPSTHKTITEISVCSPQRDKNLWAQSGQMNRGICATPSRVEKEMFDSTPKNRNLQERTAYQDPFARQSAHTSIVQKCNSSVMTPIVSSHELLSGQHASSHSITLEASSLHSSIHSFEDRLTGVRTVENTTTSHSSRSHLNLERAESTAPIPSSVSGVESQYQMNYNNVKSGHDTAALVSPNCDLPGSSQVVSTSVSEDVNNDNPKSPPMPVINDVFSLAPYRAYLEGKAPHPFPLNQESEVENVVSTSPLLKPPLSDDGMKNSSIVNVDNANNAKVENGNRVQNGEQEVSLQNTSGESVVLDLSLKKLPQTNPYPGGQQDFPCYGKDNLHIIAAESCPSKVKKQFQGKDGFMSSDNSRIVHVSQGRHSTQVSNIMVQSSQDRLSSSGPENRLSTANAHKQRQNNVLSHAPKAFAWKHQDTCQSLVAETQNNLKERSLSYATKSFSNRHQESDYSRDTERLLSQRQKSFLPQMTEHIPKELQKNRPTQDYRSKSNNFQDHYKSHYNKNLSYQAQDNSSRVPESLPQQEPSRTTSQTLRTLPTPVQHHSHSDLSVFVNTMKTQTTVLPVLLASPPAVYYTNTIGLHTSQSPSIERPVQIARNSLESCHSLSSPSGSENESSGFQSSKSFMFRKYKMKKMSSPEEETHRVGIDSTSQNVPNLFSSDTVQSLPPSAPESSPALGEANVSLASVGEPSLSSSGKQFCDLHRSVYTAITSAVARSPSNLLEDWLSKTKEDETSKIPVKTKNSFRSNDQSSDLPSHDIWLAFDGVPLRLHKLLSQLETFMFTRRCPFPHVIRAGAIFIPIYLVKEVLFPELLGPAVDKILQKHKVELRPTTLSEEKLLRETELKDCPSRMLKLLALKQLPDVYPDLLCLFCRHTIQQELGSRTQSGLHTLK
ncbi:uncharacterized protein C15orf39 homolog isoform X2 [Dendropsophus ebraccatus]|uniref:uncharacterized protein C15orf39 homolog isoform X2 n=1 Tax=Dendropsophus ebraccatus TaxID=150705 RepID=UPI003831521B